MRARRSGVIISHDDSPRRCKTISGLKYTCYYAERHPVRGLLIPERRLWEKKITRGGLITSRQDNYSIIHTRTVENKRKEKDNWCLEEKNGDLWAITIRSTGRELNAQGGSMERKAAGIARYLRRIKAN